MDVKRRLKESACNGPCPFLTGSQAYGPFTTESDIDICVTTDTAVQLKEIFTILKWEWEWVNEDYDDSHSLYLYLNDEIINFIALTEKEMKEWKEATEIMKKIEPIKDRNMRINTFHTFLYDIEGENK